MKIIIIGKSGVGKSNLSDLLRNLIFKLDKDSKIMVDDHDRQIKEFGSGQDNHTIRVARDDSNINITDYDIEIRIKTNKFKDWFDNL